LNHFADSLQAIDRAAFVFVNSTVRNAIFDRLMPFVTDKWHFIVPLAFIALYLVIKGGRQGGLIVLSAVVLVVCADAGSTALRAQFQRVRPCQALQGVRLLVGCSDSFSFPSTHATNAFALAAFFAVYYRKLAIPLLVIAALVAYSRIYVGVHYPADVLAGAGLGVTFGLTVGVCSKSLGRRWSKAGGGVSP
jgi:undecaprenyl-diphosphatase